MIIWNHRNGWVSFRHVAHQTGASAGAFSVMNVLELIFTQIGAVGPPLAYLMIIAIVYAIRSRDAKTAPADLDRRRVLRDEPPREHARKVQPNWPAPAYFTLLIATAFFLSTRLRNIESWRPWRGWFWASVGLGLVFIPIAHDTSIIYPILKPLARLMHKDMADLEPLARLRGWSTLGRYVSDQLLEMPVGTFILCDDYQQTAEMAFYVEHHPKTYCAGPYFDDPEAPLAIRHVARPSARCIVAAHRQRRDLRRQGRSDSRRSEGGV